MAAKRRKRSIPRSSVPTGREEWVVRIPGRPDFKMNESVGAGRRPVALIKAQERIMRFDPLDAYVSADVMVRYEYGEPEIVYTVERHDGIVLTSVVKQLD